MLLPLPVRTLAAVASLALAPAASGQDAERAAPHPAAASAPSAGEPAPSQPQRLLVTLPARGGDAGLALAALAWGPPDGERVVLLHGFPDVPETWAEVAPLLGDGLRVLAPALPGYSGSDAPRRPARYATPLLARDVVDFLSASAAVDGVPGARTHLVGHDWGAALAWAAALLAPSDLLSVTALSVPHPAIFEEALRTIPEQKRRSAYMRVFALPGVEHVLAGLPRARRDAAYTGNLVRAEAFTPAVSARLHAAFDTSAEARGPLCYYRRSFVDAAATETFVRALSPVRVPTLVLWGAEDAFLLPALGESSCAQVAPGVPCRAAVLPRAGHWLTWEDPAWVAARWRESFGPRGP